MNNPEQTREIGLLTPYNGGNLGDGAIQEAVIANIKARFPEVRLHGFTLDPEKTSRIHQIPCSPLTTLSLPHYGIAASPKLAVAVLPGKTAAGALESAKKFIKGIPPLFRAVRLVQTLTGVASRMPAEMRFIRDGYRKLKGFDMLIVAGGGQLDDYWGGAWGHPYTLLKWGLMARAAGVRYVFLSVGTCTLESRLSVLFVACALRLACYRSYRDHRSKQLLDRMRFTCADPVVPDLAFSHELPPCPVTRPERGETPVVAVSPIAYLSSHSWPKSDPGIYAPYLAALLAFVGALMREDVTVILYYSDTTDRVVVGEMMEKLGALTTKMVGRVEVRATESVYALLELMSEVDYVVASRLHGVILAHLAERPVLAISYDRKVTTHMATMGQSRFCLDIDKVDLESLMGAFLALRSEADQVRAGIALGRELSRSALSAQYDQILRAEGVATPAVSGTRL